MHGIDLLADIRAAPHSRRHPHFQQAALERTLPERGVADVHLPRLGGWRRPLADSPNGGWRNRSFAAMPTTQWDGSSAVASRSWRRTGVWP
jgi:hypothetical protein